jgi:hypothetical protein
MLPFFENMFREYDEILGFAEDWQKVGRVETLTDVSHRSESYSIHAFSIGDPSPESQSLLFTGGIHGLERIGTQVALSFMEHLYARVSWDELLQEHLKRLRVTFIPLVNPVGMHHRTRSNGNGVDLMRNAPIDADLSHFGVGGHRLSRHLPWYRGNPEMTEAGMEIESQCLLKRVEREILESSYLVALDLHSGFGWKDQIWFPWARSRDVFENAHQVVGLHKLLNRVMPNHVYRFEPQSLHYTTHGDLWDYAWIKHRKRNTFLPLTLEMGSWNWIKKNPLQLFSLLGPFNPIKPHRMKRAMRRHLPLLDFLMHATTSHQVWTETPISERQTAMDWWYPKP